MVASIAAARRQLADLTAATSKLLDGVELGPDRWDGEGREIHAQHQLALIELGTASVRLGELERMVAAKAAP